MKEAQAEFKDTHKLNDQASANSRNPQRLERQLRQLQLERDQVQSRLQKSKNRVQNSPNEFPPGTVDQFVDITHRLRIEQEEEAQLASQHAQLSQELQRTEDSKRAMLRRLQELHQSDIARADPDSLLNRLRDEVKGQRIASHDLAEQIREQ